ncbi:MAG: hypothetical protein NTV80_21695 [Verrucomicrobia bacterium]|nr:hypothetical protein [Verrucomicrobiota bacterium]
MDYINAVIFFEAHVTARGHLVAREEKAVSLHNCNACLRLRAIDSGVVLEITHGSNDYSKTFWSDLYSDPVGADDLSLAACIEYGLELMLPASNQPNEEAEQDVHGNTH